MKKQSSALAIVLILLFSIRMIWAQEGNENKSGNKPIIIEPADKAAIEIGGNYITIADAIKKAIENNPDILTGKYYAAMADTYYQQYLAKYSPYFAASGGVSSAKYPELMEPEYGKSNKSTGISAGLIKSFSTGSTIAGGVKYSYAKIEPGYSYLPEKVHNPVIFASLEQELLKNAFGYSDRRQEKILKNITIMQKEAILYVISLITVGVIVDYWDVIISKSLLDNSQLLLRETEKVKKIVADNARIGLAEQFEINYWQALIAASEAYVIRSEQLYADALRKFMRTLNIDEKITMQEKAVLQTRLPEINMEESIQKAYAKRADYLNAMKTLENARLQLDIHSNEALPSLTGSITGTSMDYNINRSKAVSNTQSGKYPSYEAQLKVTYPLDDTNQKANERNSKWKLEQAKHEVNKFRRIVKDDVASKIENINTNFKLYQKAGSGREQAEIYYKNILANMRRGRLTAAVVRNSLDALVNSKSQELQVLIAFNASILEFEIAKNELFDTYGIDIKKYIPEEK